MNNFPMTTFNRNIVTIDSELKQLETSNHHPIGYEAIKQWHSSTAKVSHMLLRLGNFAMNMGIFEMVAPTLYELQGRLKNLPYVPDIRTVTRAQNVLALSPYIIVTEDSKPHEQAEPELKRITITKSDGAPLFDHGFLSPKAQKGALPSWDASDPQLTRAPQSLSLSRVWNDLIKVLSGKYILAYDLNLVQIQLEVTATRFQLPMPVLIGESFLDLYFGYLGEDPLSEIANAEEAAKQLTAAYEQIGSPFSYDTSYTTIDRAACISHILQEIANGTLTIPPHTQQS